MIKSDTAQPNALLGWMDSLSDETRLRLLRLLEQQELGVAELCDVLQLPQSTVSRHLKVLHDQQWLTSRREGTAHLYRMILDELAAPARQLWLLAREQTQQWLTVRQDELRLARLLRNRADSRSFFAGAAAEWDQLRQELYGQSFSCAALLALLPADYVVADLGCGTGRLAAELAPHVQRVIGIDNSPPMLKAARKVTDSTSNVDLRKGELDNLPIDSASCDAALMVLVLTYIPEPRIAIIEMARILKPGGRAVIVDLLPHGRDDFRRHMQHSHDGFAPEQIVASLKSAGLRQAACRALPPDPATRGPALFLATAQKPAEPS